VGRGGERERRKEESVNGKRNEKKKKRRKWGRVGKGRRRGSGRGKVDRMK
jgi:hypothetical protein